MANEQLIRVVVKNIEDHNRWDQDHWAGVNPDLWDDEDVTAETIFEGIQEFDFGGETYYLFDTRLVREGVCDTSFCFAGHAVLAAGDRILINDLGDGSYCVTPEGEVRNIENRAKELLDLSAEQANDLFHHSTGHGDFNAYKRILSSLTGVTFEEEQANA